MHYRELVVWQKAMGVARGCMGWCRSCRGRRYLG